ncbi:LOW QUALITY PROTEIN: pleckstrin homology domain-containing family G member 4B [Trichechus inunguis]
MPALGCCSQLIFFSFCGNPVTMAVLESLLWHIILLSKLILAKFPVPLECYVGIQALADFPQERKESCPAAWRAHLALFTAVPRRGRQTFRAAWGGGRQNRGVLQEGERVLSLLLTAVSLKPKAAPARGVAPRRAVEVLNRHQDSDDRDRGEFWAGGVTPGRESSRPGEAVQTQYPSLTALQDGWPLCDQGKVVVQLATLLRVRLRPGNFYLHVVARAQHTARLVLTCLSWGRETGHIAVPEAMYGQVFTGEFLEQVSADRGSFPLHSCLLTTGTAIHHAPWGSITDPTSVLRGRPQPEHPLLDSIWEAPAPAMAGPLSQQGAPTLYPGCPDGGPTMPPESSDGDLEGPRVGPGPMDRRGSTEASYTGGPSPEPRGRWFRKSYVEALRNPVPLGSSSEESLLEEAADAAPRCLTQGSRPRAAASPVQRGPAPPQRPLESQPPTDRARMAPRRSRSWDKPLRSPLGNGPEAQQESCDSAGIQAAGTGATGLSAAVGSPERPQEDEGVPLASADVGADSSSSQGPKPGTFSNQPPKRLCPKDPRDSELRAPSQVLGVSPALLQLGTVTLPGTRDRSGRAVVQVCTGGPLWAREHASSAELTCLLMYLHSIPRKEVQDLGLVILVDARKGPIAPALSQALKALQNTVPPIIHSILLLVDKESAFRPDKDTAIQCEVVSSLKALHKLIDSSQLTAELDGSFPYSHSDWVCFQRKLESFTANCKQAISFLQNSVCSLNTHRALGTAQEVTELISMHRAMMKCVLEDTLLVTLRLEGGAVLARLRRDEFVAGEDSRDAIEAATRLYDWVDEEVHRLVLSSNRCLQQLEGLQELRQHQEGQAQVKQWFEREQEPSSGPVEPASPENEKEKQEAYQGFHEAAAMATRWRPPFRKHPKTPSSSPDAEHLGSGCRVAATAEPGPDGRRELWRCQARWSQGPKTGHCLEDALPEAAPGCSSPPFPQEASPSGQDTLSAQEAMHLGPGVPVPWDTPPSREGSPDSGSPCYLEPAWAPGPHLRKHPLKKIMKKTQSFESPMTDGGPREPRQLGHIGVHIKGLEVTSNVASKTPPLPRNRSLSSPSRVHHPEGDGRPRSGSRRLSSVSGSIGPGVEAAHICELIGRLHHIMAEMVSTEREYVRSLGYVIDNYFPEMERMDLPQDLRGKRGTIFGNLEKLHDFHCRHFLRELERCRHCPLAVGCSFLKHEEQFSMYALYSKNKPRSDALLSSHGNAFFKAKQQALGDKMDLASYLLKPVQRMSKYALLLKDLVKEAGHSPTQEQELGQLRAAEDMVRFQLRHGNDLLAMDAVRGCDVNLKEQGPLRCQDEFVVCCGRRKYLRQVFLFEDLILFSKTKKMDGGYDIYVYKQSFKTAEIGMTENVGDSGLRFEIWFRRRRRSQDTYILQASSVEVKSAWTSIIGRILWRQALRNRELRMQEMVSMGIGNKPFMDIKPSDAAISDRAIDYIMKGTESRSRASVAVSSFDHATPFKRPHSTISDSSTSSSSSQSSSVLGSLNLHVYPSPPGLLSTSLCPWPYDVRACIEEDELEQETGSQPSMTTESSGSSQGTSGDSASSLRSPPHPGLSRLEDNSASTPGSRTVSSNICRLDVSGRWPDSPANSRQDTALGTRSPWREDALPGLPRLAGNASRGPSFSKGPRAETMEARGLGASSVRVETGSGHRGAGPHVCGRKQGAGTGAQWPWRFVLLLPPPAHRQPLAPATVGRPPGRRPALRRFMCS